MRQREFAAERDIGSYINDCQQHCLQNAHRGQLEPCSPGLNSIKEIKHNTDTFKTGHVTLQWAQPPS
jgi:hypothetical protein